MAFDPDRLSGTHDPHAVLSEAAAAGPVQRLENGWWGVFGYDAAEEALRSSRFTSAPIALRYLEALPPGAARDEMANRINFMDPPHHTAVRGAVGRAFTPRRVSALDPWIRDTAAALVAALAPTDDGTVELMGGFAHQLPSLVISELLGVPVDDRARITGWSDQVSPLLGLTVDEDAKVAALSAAEAMAGYMRGHLDDRRRAPGNDLSSALLASCSFGGGGSMTGPELLSLVTTLYSAGHRTTRDLFGNGLAAWLRAGAPEPASSGALVEEFLRFATPTLYVARVPQEPVSLAGVAIGPWEPVIVFLAAANRDPARYRDPDRFRLDGAGPPSLSFVVGAHHCLGGVAGTGGGDRHARRAPRPVADRHAGRRVAAVAPARSVSRLRRAANPGPGRRSVDSPE